MYKVTVWQQQKINNKLHGGKKLKKKSKTRFIFCFTETKFEIIYGTVKYEVKAKNNRMTPTLLYSPFVFPTFSFDEETIIK